MEMLHNLFFVILVFTLSQLAKCVDGNALIVSIALDLPFTKCQGQNNFDDINIFLKARMSDTRLPIFQSITNDNGVIVKCVERENATSACSDAAQHPVVIICFQFPNRITEEYAIKLNNELQEAKSNAKAINGNGFVCGNSSISETCPPVNSALRSEIPDNPDGSSNSVALGVGLGVGLAALLGLVAAAATLYKKLKSNAVKDTADSSGLPVGATPIINIGDAPNSVPPAGTS